MTLLQEKQNRDLRTQIFNLKAKAELDKLAAKEDMKAMRKTLNEKDKLNRHLSDAIVQRDKTIAEMSGEIATLKKEVECLSCENEKHLSNISKLKMRLEKDSSNSSKPPSKDGLKKPHPTSSRVKSGKKPGAQPGHAGHTLSLLENPDEIIEKRAGACDCGGEIVYSEGYDAKQKVDIEVIVHVKEERAMKGHCTVCGKAHRGSFSEGFVNKVDYGDNIKALALLLSERGFVPVGRTAEIINSLSGGRIKISEGTIVNFKSKFADKLDKEIEAIIKSLESGDVVNVDETSCPNGGKLDWTQVISNEMCTLYGHNEKRGDLLAGDIDVLGAFIGTMVHDHFVTYYRYILALHAECNVHILRYLRAVTQFHDHAWSEKMAKLLTNANAFKHELMNAGKSKAPPGKIKKLFKEYDEIIKLGQKEYEQAIQGKKNISYYNDERLLLKRLQEYKDEHLRFFTDFRVPFGNNLGERDIGFFKSKLRVSGTFRSGKGVNDFLRTLSVISTARKQGINIYGMLKDIMDGKTPVADSLSRHAS